MIIKPKFELLKHSSGEVVNIPKLSRGTLKAYEVSKADRNHVIGLFEAYARTKPHVSVKLIRGELKNISIVRMPNYPLPGFATSTFVPVVNLSAFQEISVTDYQAPDIYAVFLYSVALRRFFKKKPFAKGHDFFISEMIFNVLMDIYGKRSGLTGSFRNLIPKLHFIVWLYCSESMIGAERIELKKSQAAAQLQLDYSDLDLNYDFTKITEMLECLRNNNIIPVSTIRFATDIVTRMGNMNPLPAFEDVSRFYATLLASEVSGNRLFFNYWAKVNRKLFNKLYMSSLQILNRSR